MFLREKKNTKQPTLQLVENCRNSQGKVRRRVVVSLGDCRVPDDLRRLVAAEVTHRMTGYSKLLDEDPLVSLWVRRVLEKIEAAGKMPEASRRQVQDKPQSFERVGVEDIELRMHLEESPQKASDPLLCHHHYPDRRKARTS